MELGLEHTSPQVLAFLFVSLLTKEFHFSLIERMSLVHSINI